MFDQSCLTIEKILYANIFFDNRTKARITVTIKYCLSKQHDVTDMQPFFHTKF